MSVLTTLDRPVTGRLIDVGSTDTIASGLNNLMGLGAMILPRRGGRVDTDEGVIRGVVLHDTYISRCGFLANLEKVFDGPQVTLLVLLLIVRLLILTFTLLLFN